MQKMKKKGILFAMSNPYFLMVVAVIALLSYGLYTGAIQREAQGLNILNFGHGQFSIVQSYDEINFEQTEPPTLKIEILWNPNTWEAWLVGGAWYYLDGELVGGLGGWEGGYPEKRVSTILTKVLELDISQMTLEPGEHNITVRMLNTFLDDIPSRGIPKPTSAWESCSTQASEQAEVNTKEWVDLMAACGSISFDISDTSKFNVLPPDPECTVDADCGDGFMCNEERKCELIPPEPPKESWWDKIKSFFSGLFGWWPL